MKRDDISEVMIEGGEDTPGICEVCKENEASCLKDFHMRVKESAYSETLKQTLEKGTKITVTLPLCQKCKDDTDELEKGMKKADVEPTVKIDTPASEYPKTKEVKPGDYVIYENAAVFKEKEALQEIESPLGEIETYTPGMIPKITIEVIKVVSVDIENNTFMAENDKEPKALYRVKNVLRDRSNFAYEGYDFHRIAVDSGELDKETYNEIKKLTKLQNE